MARIETWFDQDLKKPVAVHNLCGNFFNADNKGNLIGVRVYDDGEPVTLTGNAIGYCILANGVSVPVTGSISGNKLWIEMPDTAYAVPGAINIILKNANGTDVATLAAVVSSVIGFGGIIADPSQQTIDSWTAQINETISALQNGAVRYDTAQSLTAAQKTQARNNMGANTSAVLISGEDYKLVIP
jgi:hypothetical protein